MKRETQRRLIYLLSLGNICGVLLWLGNMEMAFSVLMGSTIFHFLVVQGISLIQSREGGECQFDRQKMAGLIGRQKIFADKMDGSNMFFVISYILLLLYAQIICLTRGRFRMFWEEEMDASWLWQECYTFFWRGGRLAGFHL